MLALAGAAGGQSIETDPALTPVEQGVGDVDPLQVSLRAPTGDLQQDVAFEQVYVGPDGKFYRVSGALYAQFEQSIYVSTGWGAAPVIPPGAVFFIGAPQQLIAPKPIATLADASGRVRVSQPISTKVDARVIADNPVEVQPTTWVPEVSEGSDAGTMSHEPTRQHRLQEIARNARAGK